jgi:rhodanese-related sulfurtransferase
LRETDERANSGVIANSVHVPRGLLEFVADPSSEDHKQEFQFSRRIVLYCAAGSRSALGAFVLQRMGYTNTAHLDGGLRAWKAAGETVVDVSEITRSADRQ